ncbi:MAG TPA: serine hydrolase domain-containing protein [Acidobacteriota bacterium]|jgi:CubicO group peptidase (beta-lactamase class C family)
MAGDISTQAPNARAASSERGDSLDAWIDSLRTQHNIPAMAAVVLRADTILARGIAGVRRAGFTGAVTLQDRFQLGSNTKAITATMIATLVEAGKLSWTTTPADVFPEMRDSMSPAFRGVTLEQLLSHHAGVSPFADTDDEDFKRLPRLKGTPMECRLAFTAWVLRGTPAALPGTKPIYSNGGYTIAAAIAERVTGMSWESLVRERVFGPLDIHGAFSWSDSADVAQPWGHHETRSGVKPVDPRDRSERVPSIIWPAGAVELSLDDYARFLQLHLRGLEGRDTPLLRAATIKRLHASPVTPRDNFALGWGIQEVDGAPTSVHVGSAGAFLAVTILQPTRDLAVAVFANAGGDRADKATKDALKTLIRRYAPPVHK